MVRSDAHQSVVLKAIERILRPLIKILIHNGVTYNAFSDLSKQMFVDIAEKHFKVSTRKQTQSRISTLTGLSRKDVQKYLAEEKPRFVLDTYLNRAAKVVYGWAHDEDFLHNGEPKVLHLSSGEDSFASLVGKYSGDIPSGAILDELSRAGIVEIDNEKVKLLSRTYIPTKSDTAKLQLLGMDVASLLHTFHHNIYEDSPAFLQRKVRFTNLPIEDLDILKKELTENGQQFLSTCSDAIAKYDRGDIEEEDKQDRKEVGIGIYYFEKDISRSK